MVSVLVSRLRRRGVRVEVGDGGIKDVEIPGWKDRSRSEQKSIRRDVARITELLSDSEPDAFGGTDTGGAGVASGRDMDGHPAETETDRLPEGKWHEAGITRINGIPSHKIYGDDYAAKIIAGEIPYERARREWRRARGLPKLIARTRGMRGIEIPGDGDRTPGTPRRSRPSGPPGETKLR